MSINAWVKGAGVGQYLGGAQVSWYLRQKGRRKYLWQRCRVSQPGSFVGEKQGGWGGGRRTDSCDNKLHQTPVKECKSSLSGGCYKCSLRYQMAMLSFLLWLVLLWWGAVMLVVLTLYQMCCGRSFSPGHTVSELC